jgi:hypothetical protein
LLSALLLLLLIGLLHENVTAASKNKKSFLMSD